MAPEQATHRTLFLWDEVDIYQGFKNRAPIFYIGTLEPIGPKTYINPIKVALHYNSMLKHGLVQSQADLARHLGVSRAKITQIMNLLKLAPDIQEFAIHLEETDERLQILTERKLRPLVQLENSNQQCERFWKLIDNEVGVASEAAN